MQFLESKKVENLKIFINLEVYDGTDNSEHIDLRKILHYLGARKCG